MGNQGLTDAPALMIIMDGNWSQEEYLYILLKGQPTEEYRPNNGFSISSDKSV